jgi:hypothetical protein
MAVIEYKIGTMIELPRASHRRNGKYSILLVRTNDLRRRHGISRDDAERFRSNTSSKGCCRRIRSKCSTRLASAT